MTPTPTNTQNLEIKDRSQNNSVLRSQYLFYILTIGNSIFQIQSHHHHQRNWKYEDETEYTQEHTVIDAK